MRIRQIEERLEVRASARVPLELEARGINEASIAGGWTRVLITDGTTKDIDVSYVGDVHYEDAQKIIAQVLEEVNPPNRDMWDIKGIWNAEIAHGVKSVTDQFLLHYLNRSTQFIWLLTENCTIQRAMVFRMLRQKY